MNNNKYRVQKIGIMGGTFDPVHNAHLIIAEEVFTRCSLDKIIFIPVGISPNKDCTKAQHRYNMTKLAIYGNDNFIISDIEIKRNKKTYTIDTLKELKQKYKNAQLYFIGGLDILNTMHTWKLIDEVLKNCKFIITTRPNEEINNKNQQMYKDKIILCKTSLIEISSTTIRNKISGSQSIKYLVPESVRNYIYKNDLYNINYYDKYQNEFNKLYENITQDRFLHSISVANEAKKLAIIYNYNVEKAFLAGLLHDCCKCYNKDEIYKYCFKYQFKLDEYLSKNLALVHAFLGYFVANDLYSVLDEDILNSIKYHTTGKENMSTLEKIIYIADYTEPKRTHSDSKIAREISYKCLDRAVLHILKNTIQFNIEKGNEIYYLSKNAYSYYKKELEYE